MTKKLTSYTDHYKDDTRETGGKNTEDIYLQIRYHRTF